MPKKSKRWFQSRSVWSALAKALAGIITSIALILNGELELLEFVPAVAALVWGAIDVILRFKTKEIIH